MTDASEADSPLLFFTRPFWDAVADRLNRDPEWSSKGGGLTTRVVLTCTDLAASFLLDVRDGRVSAGQAGPETSADFRFETDYASWVAIMKGEADFGPLARARRMRFRGSLIRLMLKMSAMDHMTLAAQRTPAVF